MSGTDSPKAVKAAGKPDAGSQARQATSKLGSGCILVRLVCKKLTPRAVSDSGFATTARWFDFLIFGKRRPVFGKMIRATSAAP